jgi:hypothetical protein
MAKTLNKHVGSGKPTELYSMNGYAGDLCSKNGSAAFGNGIIYCWDWSSPISGCRLSGGNSSPSSSTSGQGCDNIE